jgi:hypothetical protein
MTGSVHLSENLGYRRRGGIKLAAFRSIHEPAEPAHAVIHRTVSGEGEAIRRG